MCESCLIMRIGCLSYFPIEWNKNFLCLLVSKKSGTIRSASGSWLVEVSSSGGERDNSSGSSFARPDLCFIVKSNPCRVIWPTWLACRECPSYGPTRWELYCQYAARSSYDSVWGLKWSRSLLFIAVVSGFRGVKFATAVGNDSVIVFALLEYHSGYYLAAAVCLDEEGFCI